MNYAYENQSTMFQFNVPLSQEGRLSEVRYTLYKINFTQTGNDVTVEIPSTNSGITETDDGSYQVELSLEIGTYSINWKILGTTYVANEEINVIDNIAEKIDTISTNLSNYTAYGSGLRQGYLDIDTNLYVNTIKGGLSYDVHRITKVEIYETYEDAVNNTNILQTISEANITKISTETGRYSYTANGLSTAGTYFDKPYIIFTDSIYADATPFIFPFYNIKESASPEPSDKESAIVYLNVFDITNKPLFRDNVEVIMNVDGAWYGDDFIKRTTMKFKINSDGNVVRPVTVDGVKTYVEGMEIIETDTLTADTFSDSDDDRIVYYEINIGGILKESFTIPKGTVSANYKDLPKIESELD